MPRENKSKYAILGLLTYAPLSGYDIKKWTDESLRFFWSENYGHIYPLLKDLEKEKLVARKKVESGKGPAKNVYTITQKGTAELHSWLKIKENPEKYRIEILLKLFFSSQLTPDEIRQKLDNQVLIHEELLRQYAEVETHFADIPVERNRLSAEMTLEYGKQNSRMTIAWAKDMLRKIKSL